MSTIDILVVGAGPVGLTLAMELAIQGVAFRIVDKEPKPSDKSRALNVHSRTLEVLNRYGHIDELLAHSQKIVGNETYINRQRMAGLHIFDATQARPDSQFAGAFSISQVFTEGFLANRLAEKGITVERSVRVKSVVQDDDAATVVLIHEDGSEETVRAKYVAGCDGAHSVVRHSMDVSFEGDAYAQEFITADTMIDWEGHDGKIHFILGQGLLVMVPLGIGRSRIVLSRPSHLASQNDPTLEDFRTALEAQLPVGEKIRLHDPFWLARYHLHHRCATKYRDGRLFVAGDAAHIHSPVGGQGMNTGIQDSVNLGWKLARVLKGEEADDFLDAYHQERWPIGQHLLTQTDQLFTFLTSNTPTFNLFRNFLLPHALPSIANTDMPQNMMKYFSGLSIKYRRSPIVHTAAGFDGPLRGGFRAPDGPIQTVNGKQSWLQELLRGPGYHTLFFSKAADDKALEAELLKANLEKHEAQLHIITTMKSSNQKAVVDIDGELHKRYGFDTKPGFVHVRPDGYIENIGYLG
ncbi:hypothetical protein N0V93_004258 [Gnomoniopsis smithogilvyi]|uniref:FAD-binding domain-containing protein n=1 Tax=Gnomoniopsis smithogilvyi TaxID=1191159 RepID=A0A9W8YSA7_9PEZI|nr:hypothetical protein N0V93_004258 [Gnomoniopsis smithogilvyi]